MDSKKIEKNNIQIIEEDITPDQGRLEIDGSAKIKGTVKNGSEIFCSGDLTVEGDIYDAFVKVEGNIIITGDFKGNGKGEVIAGQDISVKGVNQQMLTAGGKINALESLIHSIIYAGDSITVSEKGVILGGQILANNYIETHIAGSVTATPTLLITGFNKQRKDEFAEIGNEWKEINRTMRLLFKANGNLNKIRALRGNLSFEQEKTQIKINSTYAALDNQREEARNKQKAFEKEHRNNDAKIKIHNKIYYGVKIEFGSIRTHIAEDTENVEIHLDNGKLKVTRLDH